MTNFAFEIIIIIHLWRIKYKILFIDKLVRKLKKRSEEHAGGVQVGKRDGESKHLTVWSQWSKDEN